MKKFLSILLINVMIVCLFTGCTQKTNTAFKATKNIKIGFAVADSNDKFWNYMINYMKKYSKSLNGVELVYVDAKQDSNIQSSQIENLISERVDAMIINPVDTLVLESAADKAKAAKVPVVSLNEPYEDQDDTLYNVGSDSKEQGILEMEYIAKKMNYKGNVAIIVGKLGGETQRLRTEAYHEVIARYPEMKIVAEQTADWNRSRSRALMETWLESGKEIDAVACNSDEMAIGAIQAIEEAGKLGKIVVGSIDATPDALDYLKSNKLAATVFQNLPGMAQCAVETAVKAAKGESVEKTRFLKNELVIPEDADKYISRWKNNQ